MPRVKITIPGKTAQPYRFNLDHDAVKIGRAKDCDIIIEEPSVSSVHATMERVSGGYILKDQGSTNGITLDDDLMEIIDLRNGDDVKVGDVKFDYELSEDELDELDLEEFSAQEKKVASGEDEEQGDDSAASTQSIELPKKPVKPKRQKSSIKKPQEKPKTKKKAHKATPKVLSQPKTSTVPPRSPAFPAPAPSSGGGFLASLMTFLLGFLAFAAGVNKTYVDAEEEAGRTEISIVKDIKFGKEEADRMNQKD